MSRQSPFVKPSDLPGYVAEPLLRVEQAQVKGAPASKWDWEAALKERSRSEGMSPGCQHIALLLSTYADGDGTSIRPSVQTIVAVSGKSRASVHQALKYLRDHGWIEQVSQGSGAKRQASEYRLTVPPRVQ